MVGQKEGEEGTPNVSRYRKSIRLCTLEVLTGVFEGIWLWKTF